jgi:hypothetical protein
MNPAPTLDQLEDEVIAIRRNTVASRSRAIYAYSIVRFLKWLFTNKPSLLTTSFIENVSLDSKGIPTDESVKSILSQQPNNPPVHFDQVTAKDFLIWLVSLRKHDGSSLGQASYSSHRSAFFNLYRDYGVTMSKTLETELTNHFRGLKRRVADTIASGNGSCKVGKDPLPFNVYQKLCMKMLLSPTREVIFARTFLIMTWNLMSRVSNTLSIRYDHIEFVEDSLCVYFPKMKNDQMGERPKDPRHVYANPTNPSICPILSLGIYWTCYEFEKDNNDLFVGSKQYERFRKILGRILDSMSDQLLELGIKTSDIGSHSIRKGSATYCSSGSTACPSSASIHLRAGWALGGVQDRYLRYEHAGDMHVGRTVSGLPTDKAEFAVLPPYFDVGSDQFDIQIIRSAIATCFPGIPDSVYGVAKYCLASLVYHSEYLLSQLPVNHPLFQTALFRQPDLVEILRKLTKCTLPSTSTPITATGIPPCTAILQHIQTISDKIDLSMSDQRENVQRVIDGIVKELENRAIGAGTVTSSGLRAELMECLKSAGLVNTQMIPQTVESTTQESNHQIHHWGGSLHIVAENFDIPNVPMKDAWQMWIVGDQRLGVPPLRRLQPRDLSTKNKRKRLSDLRYVMRKLEQRATELNIPYKNKDLQHAIDVYNQCADVIEVPDQTSNNRKRRKGQLVWLSVVRLLLKQDKH